MHVKVLFITLLIGAGLTGCNFFRAPGKDKCDKIISREKMANILGDVYLLESFLQTEKAGSPNYQDTVMYYYAGLFRQYGITHHEFIYALNCYLLHETDIQWIHEQVMQSLSILQSELVAKEEAVEQADWTAEAEKDTLHGGQPHAHLLFSKTYQWWPAIAAFAIPYVAGIRHAWPATDTAGEEKDTEQTGVVSNTATGNNEPDNDQGTFQPERNDSTLPPGLMPPVSQ